jgi:hypothetical protein
MNKPSIVKNVYVIMPVSDTSTCTGQEWVDIFHEVFVPAFRDCGYACQRASPSTGNLIKTIITELRTSWLVMADLTDRNANVFYELGVRHALSKRTILVAQDASHIPSDLRGYWWLVYGTKPGEVAAFRKEIVRLVSQVEADPDRSDSPVSDFMEHELVGISGYLGREAIKKLSALFTELTGTINTLRQVGSDVRYASFLSPTCLDLLLSTLYVDVGVSLLRQCYELRHALHVIRTGLRYDAGFVEQTRILASEVLRQVDDLKSSLTRGEFIEPSEISVMAWTPVPGGDPSAVSGQGSDWRYSRAQDLSEIDLDDLRKHLLGT